MTKKIILLGLMLLTLTMMSGCLWWHSGFDHPHGYSYHHHHSYHDHPYYDHHDRRGDKHE